FGPVVVLVIVLTFRREPPERRAALREEVWSRLGLAAALAAAFTLYIMRVGGDFMFARMLIPATPFYLLVFDTASTALPPRTPAFAALGLAVLLIAAPVFLPPPVRGARFVSGIANEHEFYGVKRATETDLWGDALRPFFAGLPVRLFLF